MGTVYFLLGLALAALAVGALAGLWWGVLVLGVELVALGVLEDADTAPRSRGTRS